MIEVVWFKRDLRVEDHAALCAALNAGQLAGAALDVQETEPPDLSQPPYNDPRVIVTPHAAGGSPRHQTVPYA